MAAGKGDRPRPPAVPPEVIEENWNRTFPPKPEDDLSQAVGWLQKLREHE